MQETKCIGGLSDAKWGSQYHQQDRVYSMGQCALALPASIPEGSYKYMEIKIIGKMDHMIDHTFESANRVYGTDGICPTLPTAQGGGIVPKIIDCVAMRGRNPENPSDRRKGIELEQRLEVREDDCVGTITIVQKDNMVLIRQATKEGFIPCEVGGGMRSELSRQQDKTRPSAREWSDMPDSDNGEYP